MLIANHKIRLQESLESIEESVTRDAVKRQRTLGFHLSAGAVDFLNIFLHQAGLTTSSSDINHRWLRSNAKIQEKLMFDFPHKTRILELLMAIEELRDPLCYGVPRSDSDVQTMIRYFRELQELFRGLGVDET